MRRGVTVGARSASPAATTRTASKSRSAVTSLSRNPLAPARSVVDVLVQVERGEDEDAGAAACGARELPGRFDALPARHADVHQDDVRGRLTAVPHRLGPAARGADDR